MKKTSILLFVSLLFGLFSVNAQVDFITLKNDKGQLDTVFTTAEIAPVYKNGNEQFFNDFIEKLYFPSVEREKKAKVTILVMFSVTPNGIVKDIEIAEKTKFPNLENEVLNSLKIFFEGKKSFTPAKVKGKNVTAAFAFDIIYKCAPYNRLESKKDSVYNPSLDTIMIDDFQQEKIYKKVVTEVGVLPLSASAFNDISAKVHENSTLSTPATFPGGEDELKKWINKNINYSEDIKKNNLQGIVVLKFIVEKDGSISDIFVLKKVNNLLDTEAKRIAGLMPKWIPGYNAGIVCRAYYTLPVRFRLSE